MLKNDLALHDQDLFYVMENLPELVRAKLYMTLEMRRLIHDPFFGRINRTKILKAERKLLTKKWIHDDPEALNLLKALEVKMMRDSQRHQKKSSLLDTMTSDIPRVSVVCQPHDTTQRVIKIAHSGRHKERTGDDENRIFDDLLEMKFIKN